jgi:hypothetical protein
MNWIIACVIAGSLLACSDREGLPPSGEGSSTTRERSPAIDTTLPDTVQPDTVMARDTASVYRSSL